MSAWPWLARTVGACVLGGSFVAAAPNAPTSPVVGSPRDFVYLGPGGPARVRLDVAFDGQPADAIWSEAVDGLFTFRDANGDGILDAEELSPFTEPRRARRPNAPVEEANLASPLRLAFNTRNPKVDRKAFATAVREAGNEPTQLAVRVALPDSRRLSAALFQRLDRDGDGKLSAVELGDARERLAPLDINEDEFIATAELTGRVAQPGARLAVQPAMESPGQQDSSTDLRMLPADPAAAVERLLADLGGGRGRSTTRRDANADDKVFARLDQNGDGKLEKAELEDWLRQPPDVQLSLDIQRREGTASFQPARPRAGRMVVTSGPEGSIRASAPGLSMGFARLPVDAVVANARSNATGEELRERLKALADSKGVIAKKQVADKPDLVSFFDLADRKKSGKLTSTEVEAALAVAKRLSGCRAEVTFVNHGEGLFELLDRDGDGRLSPRELADGPAALKPYFDPTGKVGPTDLPRRYVATVSAGSIPVLAQNASTVTQARVPARPVREPDVGLLWFNQTDRNGDGEVSLREFLGPLELFRKLDRNADGLIDGAEAMRYQDNDRSKR